MQGHLSIVQLLVKEGANVAHVNKEGKTALDVAKMDQIKVVLREVGEAYTLRDTNRGLWSCPSCGPWKSPRWSTRTLKEVLHEVGEARADLHYPPFVPSSSIRLLLGRRPGRCPSESRYARRVQDIFDLLISSLPYSVPPLARSRPLTL